MTYIDKKILKVASDIDNAKEYFATPDQFVFCLELLELSLEEDGDQYCDNAVNKLEDIFEAIEFEDFFEGPVENRGFIKLQHLIDDFNPDSPYFLNLPTNR